MSLSHNLVSLCNLFVTKQELEASFSLSTKSHLKQDTFSRLSNKIPVSVSKTEVIPTVSYSKSK